MQVIFKIFPKLFSILNFCLHIFSVKIHNRSHSPNMQPMWCPLNLLWIFRHPHVSQTIQEYAKSSFPPETQVNSKYQYFNHCNDLRHW